MPYTCEYGVMSTYEFIGELNQTWRDTRRLLSFGEMLCEVVAGLACSTAAETLPRLVSCC